MREYILSHLGEAAAWLVVCTLFSYILWKSPKLRAIIQPGEAEKTLTADKDALRKENDILRTEKEKLKNGNEYLLDELAIARTVRSTQRDKLDSSLAETERLTAQIDALKRTLTRDI